MITQFPGVSPWSDNLNNLLPFYRDVLGLKVIDESIKKKARELIETEAVSKYRKKDASLWRAREAI